MTVIKSHVAHACVLQFRPQLVLVAAGFDSVAGDPKVRCVEKKKYIN